MIRVHRPPIARFLTAEELESLSERHAAANEFTPPDDRITRAWDNFRRTRAGQAVYRALKSVFRSKCAFCERVNAKTADHFYPKERYP
jgi:hypothetical protein